MTKWKCRSISAVCNFPPIPRRLNPYLGTEKKWEMHTHLTEISDEYTKMEQEEIQLLKVGALPVGSERQKATFLSSIDKDYEAMIKDEEDPLEVLIREC